VLRALNDDRNAPGGAFGMHPHRDMDIVTYVLSGELEHQDSMGNRGVVGPGGVQYMSAGTGVRHLDRTIRPWMNCISWRCWCSPRTRERSHDMARRPFR